MVSRADVTGRKRAAMRFAFGVGLVTTVVWLVWGQATRFGGTKESAQLVIDQLIDTADNVRCRPASFIPECDDGTDATHVKPVDIARYRPQLRSKLRLNGVLWRVSGSISAPGTGFVPRFSTLVFEVDGRETGRVSLGRPAELDCPVEVTANGEVGYGRVACGWDVFDLISEIQCENR